jgi:ribosomal protein L40E
MLRFERETVTAADNDVDFANYDYVIIVAAGEVWPHASCGFDISTNDGVSSLKGFVVNEETEMETYAHELAHVLPSGLDERGNCGLPDMYSYDAVEKNQDGSIWVGPWDLMDDGSDFSAWSKIALGWLTPDKLPTKPPNVLVDDLRPVEEDSGSRAVVVEVTATVSYVVEVRRRIGYDGALPVEGVLVYYVDVSKDGGYGVVKVVDANPKTATLNDAAYGAGGLFEDPGNRVYVLVADTDGFGFTVCVSRTKVQSLKDTDRDGLLDVLEAQYGTDPADPDTDGDGLQDAEEITRYETDPLEVDTDGDGLKDGDEVLKYKSDPLKLDSDNDGLPDGEEVLKYGTNPTDSDSDHDGIADAAELRLGTNPMNRDTDSDGLLDGDESRFGTNPLQDDTDGDGLSDGREVQIGSSPLRSDTDGDYWSDAIDFAPTDSLMPNSVIVILVIIAAALLTAYRSGTIPFRRTQRGVLIPAARGTICRRCGITNRHGSRFCRRCGTALAFNVGKLCTSCGTTNRSTASFCRRCRSKLR